MEIKQEFGTWLRESRQARDLSTYNFPPVDASTLNRIEHGKSQARFHNVMEILRVLNVEFPKFVETFLGIDAEEVKAIQEKMRQQADGRASSTYRLTFDDLLILLKQYALEQHTTENRDVTWLIGASAIRVRDYQDRRRHETNYDHAEQLGDWLTYPNNDVFRTEWKKPKISESPNHTERTLNAFRKGELVTPEDAAVIWTHTIAQYNSTLPRNQKMTTQKFNRERLLLKELIQTCVHFSKEDAVKTLSLFWYAYSLDPMISTADVPTPSNESKHLKDVASLLITLWQWLVYINDEQGMGNFSYVVDLLKGKG